MTNKTAMRLKFEAANPVPFGIFWSEPDSRYMTSMVHFNCIEYEGKWLCWQSAVSAAQEASRQEQVDSDKFIQPVPDHCDRITWKGSYYHLPLSPDHSGGGAGMVLPEGFMICERGIWTEDQAESAAKCITALKDVPGMTDRDLALAAMDAGQCKAPDITLADFARLDKVKELNQ